MLCRPAEPPDGRSSRGLQNRNFTDESANSSVALARLVPRDPSQHVVSDAFHEARPEQRRSDKPVANILAVR